MEGVPTGWESRMGKRHRRKFTDEFKAEGLATPRAQKIAALKAELSRYQI